jgi:uncharacterized protein YqhQ
VGRVAEEHFSYGGQAVIDGVMIRGRKGYAVACRLADGEIKVEKRPWAPLSRRHWLLNLPIVRGTPALIDAMVIGYRSLLLSADYAAVSEGIKPPTTFQYGLSIALAMVIAIGGFVLAPSAVIQRVGGGWLLNNVVEGAIRATFFVLFLLLASRMADMRRVFQYHGAEHKVINAFEATGRYGAEEAEPYGTLHQRCGTSFIFTVLVVGIFVHALVGWPTSMVVRLGTRLLLLPVVAGVAYEIIRLAGRHKRSRVLSIMVAPGMWLQRITTQPPTPGMVEVAIEALEGALELDEESKSRGVEESKTAGESGRDHAQ